MPRLKGLMPMVMRSDTKGFTLLEMSVVLVIIAFIVTGILVGQNMVRTSRLNGSVIDVQRYIAAAQQFQRQYGGLPGDYPNTQIFPQPTTAATCDGTTPNTLPNQTCAGNGNGIIEPSGATVYQTSGSTTTTEAEELLFWQHLAIAGFIQGSFNGVGVSGNNANIPGTNSPVARVGGGYGIVYLGSINGSTSTTSTYTSTDFFNGVYNHVIFMGAYGGGNTGFPYKGLISGPEALAIDQKFDDGLPATGNIFTAKNGSTLWSYTSQTTTAVCATATSVSVPIPTYYTIQTDMSLPNPSTPICTLGFITGF